MKINNQTTDNQSELFVVVDKNDKILGYKTRHECHHDESLIHRAIGILIFNDHNQVLLQKRSKNKDTYPGYYTLSTSGHVSKGQSYKEAAIRELSEELGIDTPLKMETKFLLEMEIETEFECLFSAKYNGPFYPNKEEVDKVEFVTIDQLKQMQNKLTPFAKASLKKFNLL